MVLRRVLVDKKNIRNADLDVSAPVPLEPGQVKLEITHFALTTNNVTYAATGEQLGYWRFFPTGIADKGIIPVWGFATVVESANPGVTTGERLYGFFPMASHLTIRPGQIRTGVLIDASDNRKELPAVYNAYVRLTGKSIADEDMDSRMALLQPLFATSWLLADFLSDNEWFGAEQIIIGSASSKTGIGLTQFLAEMKPDAPEIIGLTSARNSKFVNSLRACDQVVEYGRIAEDVAARPSVYVDMAGNTEVRTMLHRHLGDLMRHSAAVGTSHWDRFAPAGKLPGAQPKFFFAPAQIVKRRQEWGDGVVEKRINEGWRRLAAQSRTWMTVERHHGLEGAKSIYCRIVEGDSTPDTGHVVLLNN